MLLIGKNSDNGQIVMLVPMLRVGTHYVRSNGNRCIKVPTQSMGTRGGVNGYCPATPNQ